MGHVLISPRMQHIESELTTTWLGHPTTVLAEVDSTNRWLKEEWAQRGKNHGVAVWADAQTQGRGRLGRTWLSPPGTNIYTSILVEPPKHRLTGIISIVAGIALIKAVRQITGMDARIKWPNDAVIHGRKFGGILVEAGTVPSPWAICGLGINVNSETDQEFHHATSLRQAHDALIIREDLWVALMTALESVYDQWLDAGDEWAAQEWTRVSATLGQEVLVKRPGGTSWTGLAERLDSDGGLWVVPLGGQRQKIIAGEVSLRLKDGRYAPDSF